MVYKKVKILFTNKQEYIELNNDCMILITGNKLINKIKELADYALVIVYLSEHQGSYIEVNNRVVNNDIEETINLTKSFNNYEKAKTNPLYSIEEYISEHGLVNNL